jgi:hypothetical protein
VTPPAAVTPAASAWARFAIAVGVGFVAGYGVRGVIRRGAAIAGRAGLERLLRAAVELALVAAAESTPTPRVDHAARRSSARRGGGHNAVATP